MCSKWLSQTRGRPHRRGTSHWRGGIATVRLTGAAAGSAMAAAVANLAGFAHGFSAPAARTAGIWVFLAALPVAALACLSAWQMGRPCAVGRKGPR